ncbi:hypothetical protein LTR10_012736 [Elasticomyces elasticus]|uniref:JmjC domain-containing protein n=1 Tax=Exophiala sideris TaxID=1016849 RepID=A0ABR0JR54_9EURO|nr:hypothetical protein LTR10_012736 [Elasticomyces elasticus]KAK5034613.1 hypothetical protein LTR13_006269 [Exophiala sideris]KAK5040065.1 hypothetical protein LTS07_000561 [Exophiala sideris]KAK5068443.1 hypothetical protein LTR69_000562 [Exophiala sideris]KAK5187745.1 hypothetical protein LTR44_000562 [Eurotiomycetes sp. CCFEE 6388]
MPHCDRHAVMTTVLCEEGYKLWLFFPHMDEGELREYAESGNYCPNYRPMAVLMCPGDVLCVPPGRIHAVYSLTTVLMTGSMHWDARHVVQVPRRSLLEEELNTLSNEDASPGFVGKVKAIAEAWRNESDPAGFEKDIDELGTATTNLWVFLRSFEKVFGRNFLVTKWIQDEEHFFILFPSPLFRNHIVSLQATAKS